MADSFLSMGGLCPEENGKRSLPPDLISEIEKNAEHGVIVNGVINWICIQKETNAMEIWKNIAMAHYDNKELKEAWEEIEKFREKLSELGLGLLKYRTSKINWLKDIGNAIDKMKDGKCMPLVMATSSMVLRAPMFRGKERGEVDIAEVADEVKELKAAMVGFMEQSSKQMRELKQQQVPKTPMVLPGAMTPRTAARKRRFSFTTNDTTEDVNEVEEVNYAEIAKRDLPQKEKAAEALAALLAKKKKAPEKTKVVYASSKTQNPDDTFAGDVAAVAHGVNKECSKEAMTEFLENKGIKVVNVSEMTRSEVLDSVRVKTMKVVVRASEYEKVMDGSNWPSRVGVRVWEDKEAKKAKYDRWQERVKNRSQVGQVSQEGINPGSQGGKDTVNSSSAGGNFSLGNRSRGFMNRKKTGNRYEGDEIIALFRQVLMA